MAYEPRTYRGLHAEKDLVHFRLQLEETDLDIGIKKESFSQGLVKEALDLLTFLRQDLMDYILVDGDFYRALSPYDLKENAPQIARDMAEAASLAGVGPMAAVAGSIAEELGLFLARYSEDVIVENGGDIWLKSSRTRQVAIYAGDSPFSYNIGIKIEPESTPLGICTSSATVGHALSFGRADAALVLASSAGLADAAATATCNFVKDLSDLERAVDFALAIPGVSGALAILGDRLAVRGHINLVPINR